MINDEMTEDKNKTKNEKKTIRWRNLFKKI